MAYDAILRYEDLNDTSTETYGFFEANIWDEMNYHRREAARYDRFDRALQQRLQRDNMTELDFVLCMDYIMTGHRNKFLKKFLKGDNKNGNLQEIL